jgi:hypothetical protein
MRGAGVAVVVDLEGEGVEEPRAGRRGRNGCEFVAGDGAE